MITLVPSPPVNLPKRADILLVDDDALVATAVGRLLVARGYSVHKAGDGAAALIEVTRGRYDVILSDIHMPRVSGIELLRALRQSENDTPVIFMTGQPGFETARDAVEHGAVQYLTKPVDMAALVRAIEKARDRGRREGRVCAGPLLDDTTFASALDSIWMAFQPIVSLARGGAVAHEALVRSSDPRFPNPQRLFESAKRAGRERELARAIRQRCADAIVDLPPGLSLFVNVDAADLTDPELFMPASPLAVHADRIVLEITEREALDEISDAADRIRALRSLGFRIAVDDLGAGYSGLSSIGLLEPNYVKLDMSLTRDIDASVMRMRLVASMISACRDLDILLIAEGVETEAELRALRSLGCDLVQGYHFARPSPRFLLVAA